jgi:hypothetical protein
MSFTSLIAPVTMVPGRGLISMMSVVVDLVGMMRERRHRRSSICAPHWFSMGHWRSSNLLAGMVERSKSTSMGSGRSPVILRHGATRLVDTAIVFMMAATTCFLVGAGFLIIEESCHAAKVTGPSSRWTLTGRSIMGAGWCVHFGHVVTRLSGGRVSMVLSSIMVAVFITVAVTLILTLIVIGTVHRWFISTMHSRFWSQNWGRHLAFITW